MIVRAYVPADWFLVLELTQRMHEESPVHGRFPLNVDKVHRLADASAAAEDWLFIVADDGDRLSGFALVTAQEMYFSDAVEVTDLVFYVRPEKRGSSVAFKMLRYVELWASSKGADKVAIGINTGINHAPAIQFFGKLGYTVQGYLVSKSVAA